MGLNTSEELRIAIENAIEDHELSRAEYDEIIRIATQDNIIDKQEQALLSQLLDMIASNEVKLVP